MTSARVVSLRKYRRKHGQETAGDAPCRRDAAESTERPEYADRRSRVLPRAAARLHAGPRARRLDRRRGRGSAPPGPLAPRRARAGGSALAVAGRGAGAEHLDLDAPVGLQALDQLAVLPLLGSHALASRAGDRLGLALARHLDVLRRRLALEVVLHRLRARPGEFLVRIILADAVGVAGGDDRLEVRVLDSPGELVELLPARALQLGLAEVEQHVG